MRRLALLAVAAALIAAGLALRLPRWPLPLTVHHSGGGLLWGGMVYALVAAGRPGRWDQGRWGRATCLAASLAIIAAIEGSRLLHAPALDAFRRTLAGQFILGRVFSGWNIVVDVAGATLVALATRRLVAPPATASRCAAAAGRASSRRMRGSAEDAVS